MTGISTLVLDVSRGKPAAGMEVLLERFDDGVWHQVSRSLTDEDGGTGPLLEPGTLTAGTLTFSNVTSHCLSPAIVFSSWMLIPGDLASTRKRVIPSSGVPPCEVRAATTI